MAWKEKTGVLNTGDALYDDCLFYVPIMSGSGSAALVDVINSANSSAGDANCTHVTVDSMLGVQSTSKDPTKWRWTGLTVFGSTIAEVTVASWVYLDTRSPDYMVPCWLYHDTDGSVMGRVNGSNSRWTYKMNGTATFDVEAADGMTLDARNSLIAVVSPSGANLFSVYVNDETTAKFTDTVGAENYPGPDITEISICTVTDISWWEPWTAGAGNSFYGMAIFNRALTEPERARLIDEGPAFLYAAASGPNLQEHLGYGSF